LDAKEETDLPQVQHDFGKFHSQLDAYSTIEPARPVLPLFASLKTNSQDHANDVQDQKRGEMLQLSLQISQRIIQLDQIRVEPVEPGTPISKRLFRGEPQDRKIAGRGTILSQAGKTVAKKRDRMLANHLFAFIHGKHRSQHPLIFSVWLAKVEVWHTSASSAESAGTLIVPRSLYVGKSCLPATPSPTTTSFSPLLSPHFAHFFSL
jgi:hypothetical protein